MVAVFVALLWFPLLEGHDAIPWDGTLQFLPAFTLTGEAARTGELRLWDPWVAGGWPLAADPQFGAFSPVVVGLGALSGGAEWGLRLYVVLLWVATGIGWCRLGGRLGAPGAVAVAVALATATSGAALSHAEHPSILSAYALLPWILERAVAAREGAPGSALAGGALWGLQALGGYPSVVLGTALLLPVALLAARPAPAAVASAPHRLASRLLRGAAVATAAGLVAALVALPALLALTGESPGFSDRARPLEATTRWHDNAYPAPAALTLASPYLAVLALRPGSPLPGVDPSFASLWLGVVPPLLVLAMLVRRRPTGRWLALLGGAAALFVLALPGSPLRVALDAALPAARYFRHGAVFKDLAGFALALAALAGARQLGSVGAGAEPTARRRLTIALTLLAAAALAAFELVLAAAPAAAPRLELARAHAIGAWLGGAWVVAAWAAAPVVGRRVWASALLALAAVDALAAVALARPLAVDSGATRRLWDELAAARRAGADLVGLGLARERWWRPEAATAPRGNHDAMAKRPAWAGYLALSNRRHEALVADGGLDAVVLGGQRLWFAARAAVVPPDETLWTAWRPTLGPDLPPALLVHPRAAMLRQGAPPSESPPIDLDALPRLAALPHRIERYEPERFETVFRAPEAGWVLVAERWAPGWEATLDGRRTEIAGGLFLLRAIAVGPGEHRLAMRYRPAGHPWAAAISWTLLAGIAASALHARRRAAPASTPAWLLYDGTCGLCDRSVQWLLARDRCGALRFARLEGPIGEEVRARHPGLPSAGESVLLVVAPGTAAERVYVRSAAALRAVARLGGPWAAARLLLAVPAPLRDLLYDWVARHRIRWFGRLPACRIPDAEERAWFLDVD